MLEQGIYAAVPWVLLVATIGALLLCAYAWTRRRQPGARWLALTLLAAGVWTGFDLVNYVVDIPQLESALKRATWALILIAGWAFFRFSCVHARRERWADRVAVPVAVAIGVNFLLMLTNDGHHLLWPGERWVVIGAARVPWLESGAAFYWVFRPTAYGLPLAAVAALLASAVGSPSFYLRQVAVLVVGALAPVITNLVFVSTAAPGLDITPVTVVVAIGAFVLSTFRFKLLEVIPVARSLLLEQLDDGVIVLDANGRVIDLNPAAERMLGCPAPPPGTAVERIAPFWDSVRQVVESNDPRSIETALGEQTVLELAASPVRGEDGSIVGRFVVLHDVSTRAQLIRELEAYAQTVARDLKNPLASLLESIESIHTAGEPIGEEAARFLQTGRQVCRQMGQTIDALLSFAQLRSTEGIDLEPLDMAGIVTSTLRRLSTAVASSHAEIVLPERWIPAVGHPIWVEEIWTNYVSNAIKYGGRPPRVELGAREEAGGVVRYWVRDNGPGLDEEQRSRLFTEFTRLDPKRTEGHGLGLSIVQRIAEKLGGAVGCDSVPGEGCTFWFTLPARADRN